MINNFTDIEPVFIIAGISRPQPARYIGTSKGKFLFEPLKSNFGQCKNGSKLIFVKDFKESELKIEGKRVLIIK